MQTITLKARADHNGVIRLEVPTDLADQEIEIVLVMQSAVDVLPRDKMGYPIGYFEATYGSFADDPLAREQLIDADTRDELE